MSIVHAAVSHIWHQIISMVGGVREPGAPSFDAVDEQHQSAAVLKRDRNCRVRLNR
jgi:hypothetical protein